MASGEEDVLNMDGASGSVGIDFWAVEAKGTLVMIQWHISLHSGLSRLGASGSVRARVSWMGFESLLSFSILGAMAVA